MMFSSSFFPGHAFFAMSGFHVIGAIAALVGVVFLLMWSGKKLSEHMLWKWGWILLLAGIVVCLITSFAFTSSSGRFGRWGQGAFGGMMGKGWDASRGCPWQGVGSGATLPAGDDAAKLPSPGRK
ncbi:MAG: hypothetical protein WCS85_03180 [Candidatus Peribacteraceae bacterium]